MLRSRMQSLPNASAIRKQSFAPGVFSRREREGWIAKVRRRRGQASQHELEQEVSAQRLGIVLVLVAAGYLVDPLPNGASPASA